jgi:uncharacterized protein
VSSNAAVDADVVAATQRWLERAVVGLNLCPFARAPLAQGRVRLRVSAATDAHALLDDLGAEAQRLMQVDAADVETTLLIHPHVFANFLDYNDFLDDVDALLAAFDLDGELQVAGFHPDYRFADSDADAIENATNRSPYPMLHLLREASIDAAIAAVPDTDAIYRRNIDTLQALGHDGWSRLNVGAKAAGGDISRSPQSD